jgi:hypothetical protein
LALSLSEWLGRTACIAPKSANLARRFGRTWVIALELSRLTFREQELNCLLLMCLGIDAQELRHQDSIDSHAFDVRIADVDISKANILEASVGKGDVSEDRTTQIDILEGGSLEVNIEKVRIYQRGVLMLE